MNSMKKLLLRCHHSGNILKALKSSYLPLQHIQMRKLDVAAVLENDKSSFSVNELENVICSRLYWSDLIKCCSENKKNCPVFVKVPSVTVQMVFCFFCFSSFFSFFIYVFYLFVFFISPILPLSLFFPYTVFIFFCFFITPLSPL